MFEKLLKIIPGKKFNELKLTLMTSGFIQVDVKMIVDDTQVLL